MLKQVNQIFQIPTILSIILGSYTTTLAGEINKTQQDIAIDGYDVTAYFSEAKPVLGSDAFTVRWKGAIWKFTSKEAQDRFEANPERYAPQYGGHCANGMSLDHKVYGNPKIWRIINNKLYLFFSHNGRKRWANKTDRWIKDADNYWQQVKDE